MASYNNRPTENEMRNGSSKRSVRRKPPPLESVEMDYGAQVPMERSGDAGRGRRSYESDIEVRLVVEDNLGSAEGVLPQTTMLSLYSQESPRPMGPKLLPEMANFMSSVHEPLRSMRTPSYPIHDPVMAIHVLDEDGSSEDEYEHHDDTTFFSPYASPPNATPSHARTSEIIQQSTLTPVKMPSLHDSNALRIPYSPPNTHVPTRSSRLDSREEVTTDTSYSPLSASPRSHNSDLSFSTPYKFSTASGLSNSSTRNSSPLRSQTISNSAHSSPINEPFLDRRFSEKQYYSSRSPSPRRPFNPSPSLIGSNRGFALREDDISGDVYDNDNDLNESENDDAYNDYDQSYLTIKERGHKWPKMKRLDTNFADGNADYAETPTAKYFDYSILPELPGDSTYNPISSSPEKRLTLNSTISFIKRDSNTALSNSTTLFSKKKKDDELPPIPLDLPRIPFSSSSLTSLHFASCGNVWSLGSIFKWCLKLKEWLLDQPISKREFKKALIKLLVFYKRNVSFDIIGMNTDIIIESLLSSEAIRFESQSHSPKESPQLSPQISPQHLPKEDNLNQNNKDSHGKDTIRVIMDDSVYVSGVLVDLTDCYCHDGDHTHSGSSHSKLRCYSSQCHLNVVIEHERRFRETDTKNIKLGDDWASHWKLTAEDLRKYDKYLCKKQSLVFDLIKYEQTFINRAKCFVDIVGPEFIKVVHLLVGANEVILMSKFEDDVLKPGRKLIEVHQEHLFEPLVRILVSKGKFINDLTDIANLYYNWSLKAKNGLLTYISTVPMIEDLLKNENVKRWVDVEIRSMEGVKELKVNGSLLFLSTFNSRYQQLPLQLSDIRKLYDPQDQEYISLTRALDSIRRLGAKVNEAKRHADNIFELKKIHKQLTWKNGINHVNKNFSSENRKFFYRGNLMRKGDLKINSVTNHLILLDNYLFITEKTKNPKTSQCTYKVVENPIAIELLLFEIKEKETANSALDLKAKTKSLTTLSSPVSPNNLGPMESEMDLSTFPFKIRNAGRGKHNAFTFSTKSEKERNEWIKYLTLAKSNLHKRLQKTEPYKLNPISLTNFGYDIHHKITKLQVCAPFDPIYDVAEESALMLKALGCGNDIYNHPEAKNHVLYNKALSTASFVYNGQEYRFVGTATGIYCSTNKSYWKKVANGSDVTKINVFPHLNLVIFLNNKSLLGLLLDLVMGVFYDTRKFVSGVYITNDPVQFFSTGRHRNVLVIFAAMKKSASTGVTNFKVFVPETDHNGVFNYFNVAKRFYIQAECYGVSIFNSSFAVHTNKGVEVLDLDKLLPRPIPELPYSESSKKIDGFSRRFSGHHGAHNGLDSVRRHVNATTIKPMGMFKLNNNSEFLLVYCDFAIFINKYGKLSRYSLLKFEFKAKSIAFLNNNLFLFCEEVLEIWSISDFVHGSNRLIQVITGKDITMLSNEGSVCFGMANPKVPGQQLVLELETKGYI